MDPAEALAGGPRNLGPQRQVLAVGVINRARTNRTVPRPMRLPTGSNTPHHTTPNQHPAPTTGGCNGSSHGDASSKKRTKSAAAKNPLKTKTTPPTNPTHRKTNNERPRSHRLANPRRHRRPPLVLHRTLLLSGKVTSYKLDGWKRRATATYDARQVRVADFELALQTISAAAQALVLPFTTRATPGPRGQRHSRHHRLRRAPPTPARTRAH